MTFGPQLSLCPSCSYFSMKVIETRVTKLAKRRRSECQKCGHRITTHEVSDEFFNEAKVNARTVEKLRELVSIKTPQVALCKCDSCSHNVADNCSLGFPEFLTPDADDCNHFTT